MKVQSQLSKAFHEGRYWLGETLLGLAVMLVVGPIAFVPLVPDSLGYLAIIELLGCTAGFWGYLLSGRHQSPYTQIF